jgi:Protein of unknown function (DUF1364)
VQHEATALRDFAKHKPCMARLLGICNWRWETTVLAHIRRAKVAGTGIKPPDLCAIFACSACHDEIDRRTRNHTLEAIDGALLDALVRQYAWYAEHQILVVAI